MITTKIPTFQPATLYEASQLSQGCDITDKDWDICMFFGCPETWEAAIDAYDRFMLLIGCNIRVEHYSANGYTTCYLAEFMWENRDVFDPFFNENNREGYRPMDYKDLDPECDDGFYEAYMQPLESLMIGNYSENDYQFLYEKLVAKAASNNSKK